MLISSDEGFSVETLGRSGIMYREGVKALRVDSELLAPGYGIAVYKNSIKAWLPVGQLPISELAIDELNQERILNNIRRAIASQGLPVEIV